MTAICPEPVARPLVGHALELAGDRPTQRLMELGRELGPIYRLRVFDRRIVVVSSHALAHELCDTSRFEKRLPGPLAQLRDLGGDGLFTAFNDEPNWALAHRLLAPAFGALAMRGYFDRMLEISQQLIDRWVRAGPDQTVDVVDDMTRLTFDTIALCGFDYRFDSFFRSGSHPFVEAMVGALVESQKRAIQPGLVRTLRFSASRRYFDDIALMNEVVDTVVRERRAAAEPGDDLLGRMLSARDDDGRGLSDENIRYQIVTFLIAGHETTSGLLSFALHLLLEHPAICARARAQVDAVMGDETPRFEHLAGLELIDRILRETLRLWPTAPGFVLGTPTPTTLGGFAVEPRDEIVLLSALMHRDPAVWEDPERFDPDRFLPERRATIPEHAWKPFGNGHRACIGRLFAMQEATLVLSMVLQRFDFERAPGSSSTLEIQESLTFKPTELRLRCRVRQPAPRARSVPPPGAALPGAPALGDRAFGDPALGDSVRPNPGGARVAQQHETPLTVLYGSQTGTARALAERIARAGTGSGYRARVRSMDAAVDDLPDSGVLVIVTASYNGAPPENARRFCDWLDTTEGRLEGLPSAVLGCGHRDWVQTFQAVPIRVEAALRRLGSPPLIDRGVLDAADDLEQQAQRWMSDFWARTHDTFGVTARASAAPLPLELELLPPTDPLAAHFGLESIEVVSVRELVDMSAPHARSKRAVELRLPEGMDYQPGQHLELLGENAPERVDAWLAWLSLPGDQLLRRTAGGAGPLPSDRPLALRTVLARYLDLGQPASRRALRAVLDAIRCPPERGPLTRWLADDERYRAEVVTPRLDLLTVLQRCPSARLPLAQVIDLLPPMRPRRYSISSSPRIDPRRCTLTVAWVSGPARSTTLSQRRRYEGVASGTLCRARPGQRLYAAVRRPHTPFALPEDDATPLLMIAAGSGIAPFRGFLEERAQRQAAGATPAPAHLFFGCDAPQVDLLYADQLRAWQEAGLLTLHTAFSEQPEGAIRFVQHRLEAERALVSRLIDQGATLYLCGDGARMAPAVLDALARIEAGRSGLSHAEAVRTVMTWRAEGRLQCDIFQPTPAG